MVGEKRRKSGEAGFSLISDMLKAVLHSRFWMQGNHFRFCWLWEGSENKQTGDCFFTAPVKEEKQLQRERVSPSALVQNGMVAVCLGVWLFSCKNIQAIALWGITSYGRDPGNTLTVPRLCYPLVKNATLHWRWFSLYCLTTPWETHHCLVSFSGRGRRGEELSRVWRNNEWNYSILNYLTFLKKENWERAGVNNTEHQLWA